MVFFSPLVAHIITELRHNLFKNTFMTMAYKMSILASDAFVPNLCVTVYNLTRNLNVYVLNLSTF